MIKVLEYHYPLVDTCQRHKEPKVWKGNYDTWHDAYKAFFKHLPPGGYLDIVYHREEETA